MIRKAVYIESFIGIIVADICSRSISDHISCIPSGVDASLRYVPVTPASRRLIRLVLPLVD